MKIDMKNVAMEGMVLDFLHQREALGPGISSHAQVHEDVLAGVLGQSVAKSARIKLKVLGRCDPSVNDGWDLTGGTKFFNGTVPDCRARLRAHCN